MKPIEKKLLKLFNRLGAPERDMLLGFAEYLVNRTAEAAKGAQIASQTITETTCRIRYARHRKEIIKTVCSR